MKASSSLPWMRLYIHVIALFLALPVVHGQFDPNSRPLLTLTFPTNGARFIAPADLGVSASVDDPEERVDRVDFFANTNLIASSELFRIFPGFPLPVGQPWDFVPVGDYTLTAVARDALGAPLGTSSPVHITVEFFCKQGIVLRPQVSDTVVFLPELGLLIDTSGHLGGAPDDRLDFLQSAYFKTTANNREFRRGFAEFAIPLLPVRFSSANLALTMSSQGGDVHELSYYLADLAIDTNDFDQPTIPWAAFLMPPSQQQQTLLLDVTELVAQFEGTNLGFRLKLAADPAFDQIDSRGAGFAPPRLLLHTCSNPPPSVSVLARDPFASERQDPRKLDPAEFLIRRTGPTNAALTVHYSVTGTALNGIDYEELSGLVTIPAGKFFARMMVRPVDDSIVELTESVVLNLELAPPVLDSKARLSLPPPYLLDSRDRATASILDNSRLKWFGKWP